MKDFFKPEMFRLKEEDGSQYLSFNEATVIARVANAKLEEYLKTCLHVAGRLGSIPGQKGLWGWNTTISSTDTHTAILWDVTPIEETITSRG